MDVFNDLPDAALGRIRAGRDEYTSAAPFPHGVFTGLFDEGFLDAVTAEFHTPDAMSQQFDDQRQLKSAESDWTRFGPHTRQLFSEIHSAPFVEALEELTGIDGLITDHQLLGGGQHQIASGGRLGVHADFNRHRKLRLDRRLNLLLYLNRDWEPDWGGELELWDTEMTAAVRRIPPTFNTLVVFTTTSDSFHGHPEPLRTPAGVTRKSIASYYYSNSDRPSAEVVDHSTLFRQRPADRPPISRARRAAGHFKAGLRLLLPESAAERLRRR